MSKIVFPEGIIFRRAPENAPEWIKGKISFKVDEFTKWMKQYKNEDGWVSLDIRKAMKGNLYLALNEYKKKDKEPSEPSQTVVEELPQEF